MTLKMTLRLCLLLLVLYFHQTLGQSAANNLGKVSSGRKGALREQYLSKSYGEMQFSKYKGQLPAKGSIVECAIECFSLASCHCLRIDVNTNECSFMAAQESLNLTKAELANYIFYTRDSFTPGDDNLERIDIGSKAKMTMSHVLVGSKGKVKGKASEGVLVGNSSKPWVQFEFKESMYITEVQLSAFPAVQLKRFLIRVGDQPADKQTSDVFDQNAPCYEHNDGKHFFAPTTTRRNPSLRSVKCQPCGLYGRYLTIQAFEPCLTCLEGNKTITSETKPTKAKGKTETSSDIGALYPLPVKAIAVYGYSLK